MTKSLFTQFYTLWIVMEFNAYAWFYEGYEWLTVC